MTDSVLTTTLHFNISALTFTSILNLEWNGIMNQILPLMYLNLKFAFVY